MRRTTYPDASHRSCTSVKWKRAGLYAHWMVTAHRPHLKSVRSWNSGEVAASRDRETCQATLDWQRGDGSGLSAGSQRLCGVAPVKGIQSRAKHDTKRCRIYLDNVLPVENFWLPEPLLLDLMVPFPSNHRHSKKRVKCQRSRTSYFPRVFAAQLR
jgi:hypothetical protein